MQNADFRTQTVVPTSPTTGVYTLYVNADGILTQVDSNGTLRQAGNRWTGTFGNGAVATGGTASLTSGTVFTSDAGVVTGLANPIAWLPVKGPAGQNWVVPAWAMR